MSDTLGKTEINNRVILINGKTCSGKSTSLQGLTDHDRVLYMNCEAGKALPFPNKIRQIIITDPLKVGETINKANSKSQLDTIVIDSMSMLLQMYENIYISQCRDKRDAWGDYANFIVELMQQKVASCSKNIIFTSHVEDVYNEAQMQIETKASVKGSISNKIGLEAFFTNVVMAKRIPLEMLTSYENPMLNITADDEIVGYKYVFQTKHTKETIHERIRHPIGMWATNETYIDNNIQHILDRLEEYYSQ